MSENEQIEGLKQTWGAGDFGAIAVKIRSASERAIAAAAIGAGDKVLDVACGTGNAAIPAAELGAEVTGLDIIPDLLEQGRAAATEAGVEIDWVEGDAGALPFPDASFDVVISVFGCMFAPDQQGAAAEIARVLRPGGRMAVCAWTPESKVTAGFRELAEYMPPPAPGFKPPALWGDPEHVKGLFDGLGIDLSFERDAVNFVYESAESSIDELATYFGPMVNLREAFEPQGKWPEIREKLIATAERDNESSEGDMRYAADYTISKGISAAG